MTARELFPDVTYRSNNSGTLQAAYIGEVRIGYVQQCPSHWIWQTILIRPEGGAYFGKAGDEEEAKGFVLASIIHWLDAANLQPRPKETTHATPPLDDTTGSSRRDAGPRTTVRGRRVPKPKAKEADRAP